MPQPVIKPPIRRLSRRAWKGMLAVVIDRADAVAGAEQAIDRQPRVDERPTRIAIGAVTAAAMRIVPVRVRLAA
jgi:hypothetical protein